MFVPSQASTLRPTVLLVDDERAYLEVLRAGLQRDFDIQLAENAEDAELRMSLSDYDVIVCDHMMPGEQGLDFLIRVSQSHPKTRRILMTGYMNPELLSRSVPVANLSSFVLKPVGIAHLTQVIRKALETPAG
jgi:DNA-binding NtrC family response regulator